VGTNEQLAVDTLDACFASLRVAQARYAAAQGKDRRSLARVLGAIAERAVELGERNAEHLRMYMAALLTAQTFRSGIDALPALAIARARAHAGGLATVLARADGASYEPVTYRFADVSAPAEPLVESVQREQMRRGVCAMVRFNRSGRFAVELHLVSTLDVTVPELYSMSAAQAVHAPSGQLVLRGAAVVPDATIDVPAGWYDVAFCTLQSERRVLLLLAPTERRSNDAPLVDVL
jgi:hypothetical protein